jgi:hypothetical protein
MLWVRNVALQDLTPDFRAACVGKVVGYAPVGDEGGGLGVGETVLLKGSLGIWILCKICICRFC